MKHKFKVIIIHFFQSCRWILQEISLGNNSLKLLPNESTFEAQMDLLAFCNLSFNLGSGFFLDKIELQQRTSARKQNKHRLWQPGLSDSFQLLSTYCLPVRVTLEFWTNDPNFWDSTYQVRPLTPILQIKRHGEGQKGDLLHSLGHTTGRSKSKHSAHLQSSSGYRCEL